MANLTFRAHLCLGGLKAKHEEDFVSFNENIGGGGNSQVVFACLLVSKGNGKCNGVNRE